MREIAFPAYVVTSSPPGTAFYVAVLGYTAVCFLLIAPLVTWSRNAEKQRQLEEEMVPSKQVDSSRSLNTSKPSQPSQPPKQSTKASSLISGGTMTPARSTVSKVSARSNRSGRGLLSFIDRVAAAQYPDENPDFSRMSEQHSRSGGTAQSTSTGTLSAATTTQLVAPKRLSSFVLDVGGRRWKNRRPIGRVDVVQNVVSSGSTVSALSSTVSRLTKVSKAKGMSDKANSVLEETKEIRPNPLPNTRRPSATMQYHRSRFLRRPSRNGSLHSAQSVRSAMSSIVDDISPHDAADANDPGRGNIFTQAQQEIDPLKLACCSGFLESLLILAAPGEEVRRMVYNAVPLSIGAMSEAVVRLVTAGFISHYIGAEALIAYLLVGLFVRLTSEELSGAIIDAASSFIQAALCSQHPEAVSVAGHYVQHAIVLQLLLGVPLLGAWAFYMENVVQWLVESDRIAAMAQDYTRVIVVYYLVQSVTRTCTVVFHICGHEHFESFIDLTILSLQLVVVASAIAEVEHASLTTVGSIQVLIGVAGGVAKLLYPAMRGWMKPFRKSIFGQVGLYHDRQGFMQLCRAFVPLLLGTLLEYGEWEVLTLFLHHLGSAEVAAWAILGAIWDVLEALTEGVGEAAAIQVTLLLAASHPERARRLANTFMYLATIQSLIVTSLLYMFGKHLAIIMTSDPTLQHFVNNSIGLLGLANVTMAFSQVGWSLIGAQGRFRLATSVNFSARWFVTIPSALLIIRAFELDIDALSGALVVGYATASCAMTFIILRSDWERLSHTLKDIKGHKDKEPEGDEDDDHGDPFDADDASSSEGFGFGGDENSEVTGVKSEASRRVTHKSKGTPALNQ
jgi:multidrug resistance protein, MATE family